MTGIASAVHSNSANGVHAAHLLHDHSSVAAVAIAIGEGIGMQLALPL
jgi:hypothetical protein